MKLLLVGSDAEVQQWAETHLSKEGFDVAVYGDGLSALDMLAVVEPDLILADLNLPGINIFRFCNKLRQKAGSKSVPIFLLVTPGEEMDESRLRSAGIVDFISLPMKLTDVLAKIKPATPDRKAASAPAPAASAAVESPSKPEDQVEGLKIEELLGWSPAAEKRGGETASESGGEAAAEEDERTVIADMAGVMPAAGPEPAEESSKAVESGNSRDPQSSEDQTVVMSPQASQAGEFKTKSGGQREPTPESMLISGSMAELSELASAAGDKVRPPSAQAESSPENPAGDPQAIEAAVKKVAREVIEKIAWEVVPTIAEGLIKEELEKLKSKKSE